MDFLREQFEEQLEAEIDDNGSILINGTEFFPYQILKEQDPQSYQSSFEDWLFEQKENRLLKASEILDQFNNRNRFNRLKEAFNNNAIVPFIGAGLSQSSDYPGWTGFLYDLREETRVTETQLTDMIKAGQYEEAAQALFDDMPAGSFNEALENVYRAERKICGPVQFLPYMFKGPVVTTNFDNVLKQCFDRERPFSEIILGGDAHEIRRLIGRKENILVKLHGKANSGKYRILTKDEYDRFYHDENSLPSVIRAIASEQLLFIGCSLNLDRTIEVLIDIAKSQGHDNAPRHYAFMPFFEGEDRLQRLQRRDELAEANIYPIWYPIEKFDDPALNNEAHDEAVAALLQELGLPE